MTYLLTKRAVRVPIAKSERSMSMGKQQAAVQTAEGSRFKRFEVGYKVKWTSQSSGSWKEKTGTVVAAIPAGDLSPVSRRLLETYKLETGWRDHVSYIVNVPTKSGRGKGTFYRPLVSKLQRVV